MAVQPAAESLSDYRGRFAPSPSGPLHAGSLVAALGSYLDARAHAGTWLVRIEDIDPPREVAGAADTILRQLENHGLHWDGQVTWQHQHGARYQAVLEQLTQHEFVYRCHCTRAEIKARAPHYDGFCRTRQSSVLTSSRRFALRLHNTQPVTSFQDRFHGEVICETALAHEDFVLRRRDGLWAYQLAVVADDRAEGITHLVRGEDLLHASAWQLTLWRQLNALGASTVPLPHLAHLPLVYGPDGRKLSKQNHAPALDETKPLENLYYAVQALRLVPEPLHAYSDIDELLTHAQALWSQTKTTENKTQQG
ncbi:tRNA glutamyl-Q(34) synthetase GluQRS [Aliidiomarina sanyensis]|uniref:Glutamyl-Q tRNA(Asp) synthetase n=1 Tax=Aliidiomarina sanyensis TaxID=1249555 RepID=A0A432WCE3_9GAMM|nr:tRNA glutamyl-Q(34) synthetase GluQRS [Aliidiomarina sanyensis]RUO30148.1 tRNA glutamyl-Q(34) synthetase GluQRS [Aliidiomarina sanyensis]